jgi:CheY-like chemotaxis protein
MTLLLSGWGCTVLASDSLKDSLRIAETEDAPDVIFADFHLDDGTGIETIIALRKLWRMDIPALLVTADRTRKCAAWQKPSGSLFRTSRSNPPR